MFKTNGVAIKKPSPGFTLIELLLVIVIIGGIIAIIIPRAWRANMEAKYEIVRQSATELGNWGMTWAERNLESQASTIDCNLNTYVSTLGNASGIGYTGNSNTNWVGTNNVSCPTSGTTTITGSVSSIMPTEKQPRNPFNGLSYFNAGNNGSTVQSGLLYLGVVSDSGYNNYYFIYTGTDSTSASNWHAGMGSGTNPIPLVNLRNGIFMARLRP